MEAELPKKNKGGQPKKDIEIFRNSYLRTRFTKAELEKMTKKINTEFLKSRLKYKGQYVYLRIMEYSIPEKQVLNIAPDLKADFRNIGNNINQIAASLNTKKTDPLYKEMLHKLTIISQQLEKIALQKTDFSK